MIDPRRAHEVPRARALDTLDGCSPGIIPRSPRPRDQAQPADDGHLLVKGAIFKRAENRHEQRPWYDLPRPQAGPPISSHQYPFPFSRENQMDGMMVQTYSLVTGSADREFTSSHTINLSSPTAVIAEVSVSSFSYLYGSKMDASCYFTACTTDGSNASLPPNETFDFFGGSLSGHPRQVVIRSGLTSLSYEIGVQNCMADFTVNIFFWPSVDRGSL